jgi:hypothetical protein
MNEIRVEFLDDPSIEQSSVRIYGTNSHALALFHMELLGLAQGSKGQCPVHEIPDFCSVNGCTLFVVISDKGEGVRKVSQAFDFVWGLQQAKWFIVAGLVEPFTQSPQQGSYQWLAGTEARYGLSSPSFPVLLSYSEEGRW